MRQREFYKTTPLGREEEDMSCNHILVPYPDEDLFEDGELDEAGVEEKIITLWRMGKIVIARWED